MKYLISLVCAVTVGIAFIVPSSSYAGTYLLNDCQLANPTPGAIFATQSSNVSGAFTFGDSCASNAPYDGYGVFTKSRTYNQGDLGRVKYTAPIGLGIKGASFWTWDQVSSDGSVWKANYLFHNEGSNVVSIPVTPNDIKSYDAEVSSGYRTNFEANLKCMATTCPSTSLTAYLHLGSIALTVTDPDPPVAYGGSGTLYNAGTVGGSRTASFPAADGGSGVWLIWLKVNGQAATLATGSSTGTGVSCNPSTPTYNAWRPCQSTLVGNWTVNTAQSPFVEGSNTVSTCARDYSGADDCSTPVTVNVHN